MWLICVSKTVHVMHSCYESQNDCSCVNPYSEFDVAGGKCILHYIYAVNSGVDNDSDFVSHGKQMKS